MVRNDRLIRSDRLPRNDVALGLPHSWDLRRNRLVILNAWNRLARISRLRCLLWPTWSSVLWNNLTKGNDARHWRDRLRLLRQGLSGLGLQKHCLARQYLARLGLTW